MKSNWLGNVKSDFFNNVLLLMTGSIVAQVIPLLLAPLLTRLYSPSEFGEYALFISITSIITIISSGRYEMAIILPKLEKNARTIFYLSCLIVTITALVTLIFIVVFFDTFSGYLNPKFLYLISFSILVSGLLQSGRVWINRKKSYKKLALNNIEQTSMSSLSQITFAWLNLKSLGLVYGQLLGQIIALVSLISFSVNSFSRISKVELLRMRVLFIRYLYLLKLGVPALLISRAAQESLVLLTGYYMGNNIVGLISLLNRIISMPSSVISSNLGRVFYQEISVVDKNKSYPLVKKFATLLTIVSIPIFVLFYYIFNLVFIYIFGLKWSAALEYAPYLFVVACFSFIFSPLTTLFNYYEIQGWNLIWQSSWLASNILIFFLYNFFSLQVKDVFLFYSINQGLLYIIGIVSFMVLSKRMYEEE